MDKLKLNAEQISKLLRDKFLVIDDCKTIEIEEESLISQYVITLLIIKLTPKILAYTKG